MNYLEEYKDSHEVAKMLFETGQYKTLGFGNVFLIVQMSKTLGMNPMEGLNGGLWPTRGKVELSASMMNALIRRSGHSVVKDEKSDDKVCILRGKRRDSGDTCLVKFSMDDANRAGIAKGDAWRKFPQSMLFARALSILARQLFPDVIKNCYVEGEISGSSPIGGESVEVEDHSVSDDKEMMSTEVVYQERDKLPDGFKNIKPTFDDAETDQLENDIFEVMKKDGLPLEYFSGYKNMMMQKNNYDYVDLLRNVSKKEVTPTFLKHYQKYCEIESKKSEKAS